MALKVWWDGDTSQRFWMEATDREDLGSDLRAPKGGSAGQAVWHYDLVSLVQPGDIVFHWHTRLHRHPALVGWSEVIGDVIERPYRWVAHTSTKREAIESPNWVVPLGYLTLLDQPIFGKELLTIREQILGLSASLADEYSNFGYFPFAKYGEGMRAQQAYLTKFPSELVDLIGSTFDLELSGLTLGGGGIEPIPRAAGGGFIRDAQRRIAIEQHAVSRAMALYEEMGASEIEILGKPYDLRVQLSGEEIHVEVKGSSGTAERVIVTRNEVAHARTHALTELVVIDDIAVALVDGEPVASGGRLRRWSGWCPSDKSLVPLSYEHSLPLG